MHVSNLQIQGDGRVQTGADVCDSYRVSLPCREVSSNFGQSAQKWGRNGGEMGEKRRRAACSAHDSDQIVIRSPCGHLRPCWYQVEPQITVISGQVMLYLGLFVCLFLIVLAKCRVSLQQDPYLSVSISRQRCYESRQTWT